MSNRRKTRLPAGVPRCQASGCRRSAGHVAGTGRQQVRSCELHWPELLDALAELGAVVTGCQSACCAAY